MLKDLIKAKHMALSMNASKTKIIRFNVKVKRGNIKLGEL